MAGLISVIIVCFDFCHQGYPGKYYCPRMNSMNKPTYAAICTHSPIKPVLIFVSSRRQTRLTALDLIQVSIIVMSKLCTNCSNLIYCAFLWLKFAAADELPRQFLAMPEEALQMLLSQVADQNLRHTLQFGIGLHHAGLNDKDRSLVEELFANNKIQAIISHVYLAFRVWEETMIWCTIIIWPNFFMPLSHL